MYGIRLPQQTEYPVYVLTYDKDTFNFPTWMDHRKMFFTYTIPHYDQYSQNQFQDPFEKKTKIKLRRLNLPEAFYNKLFNTEREIKNYPFWLKNYMQLNLNKPIRLMTVAKYWVHYRADGRIVFDSHQLLIKE